jgi:hypothetical protein
MGGSFGPAGANDARKRQNRAQLPARDRLAFPSSRSIIIIDMVNKLMERKRLVAEDYNPMMAPR